MTDAVSPRAAAAALAELQRRRRAVRNFCPHEPYPKQREFLALDCREALYGGAAGGGKSDALLMAAAQYVHVPGYRALIIRRTYADLAKDDAIMTRAKEWWIPQGIAWSEKDKRFTFPSGASIAFGYMDSESDKYTYQGGAWQFVGFDELTQFPEAWYTYLFTRQRKAALLDVPVRMRAASNPGGIGHDWVYRRFVNKKTARAPFIPALAADNPSLDLADYRESMALVDPTLRRQLEAGEWIRDGAGLVYAHFDAARNLIDAAPPIETRLLALDFGVNDRNALAVLGWREHDPNVYVTRAYKLRGIVDDMAREIRALEESDGPFAMVVGDTGGMGKLFAEELIQRHGIPVQPAEKSNKLGFISLFNSDLAIGRIKVMRSGCVDLVAEWVELPWHASRLKEAEGFENHASDAVLYGWRRTLAYHERPEEPAPRPGTPEAGRAVEQGLLRATLDDMERDGWEQRYG